jgi:hypothetical protein
MRLNQEKSFKSGYERGKWRNNNAWNVKVSETITMKMFPAVS